MPKPAPQGQPQAVPPEGSLGLLAYGDLGLEAWRAARTAAGLSKCSHSRPIPKPEPAEPARPTEPADPTSPPDA